MRHYVEAEGDVLCQWKPWHAGLHHGVSAPRVGKVANIAYTKPLRNASTSKYRLGFLICTNWHRLWTPYSR